MAPLTPGQKNLKTQLWLGLPSTLIENEAFRSRSLNQKNLQTPAFRFSVRVHRKLSAAGYC